MKPVLVLGANFAAFIVPWAITGVFWLGVFVCLLAIIVTLCLMHLARVRRKTIYIKPR